MDYRAVWQSELFYPSFVLPVCTSLRNPANSALGKMGSSGKCVPIGEERSKAFLMKVIKNSNIKMQTDKSKFKNVGDYDA